MAYAILIAWALVVAGIFVVLVRAFVKEARKGHRSAAYWRGADE